MRTDNSDNNVVEAYATDGLEDVIVRRGFRGDKFVATYKRQPLTQRGPRGGLNRVAIAWRCPARRVKGSFHADSNPGFLVRWLSPGDYLSLSIWASDGKARLYKRQSDGSFSRLVISGTGLSLTTNTWYEAKVVVDTDPMDDPCQRLRFWVDTDNDGDYADETTLISSTAVDDVWSAGYVGLRCCRVQAAEAAAPATGPQPPRGDAIARRAALRVGKRP